MLLAGPGSPHQKGQRRQTADYDRHHPEAVFETERVRLSEYRLVCERKCLVRRGCGIVSLRDEERFKPVQPAGAVLRVVAMTARMKRVVCVLLHPVTFRR